MAYFDEELKKYGLPSSAPLSNTLAAPASQEMATPLQLPNQQPGVLNQMATAAGTKVVDKGIDALGKKAVSDNVMGPLAAQEGANVASAMANGIDMGSAVAAADAASQAASATDAIAGAAGGAPLGGAMEVGKALMTGSGKDTLSAAGAVGGAALGNMLLPGVGGAIGSKLGGMAGSAVGGK